MEQPTPLPGPIQVDAERRRVERRKPMVILEAENALEIMLRRGYTGAFIGHAHQGIVKRIEIVNPSLWD